MKNVWKYGRENRYMEADIVLIINKFPISRPIPAVTSLHFIVTSQILNSLNRQQWETKSKSWRRIGLLDVYQLLLLNREYASPFQIRWSRFAAQFGNTGFEKLKFIIWFETKIDCLHNEQHQVLCLHRGSRSLAQFTFLTPNGSHAARVFYLLIKHVLSLLSHFFCFPAAFPIPWISLSGYLATLIRIFVRTSPAPSHFH